MKLERLRWKYERLVELRARREALEAAGHTGFPEDEARERKRAFRRIARACPGALRELDALSAAALARRRDEVDEALEGGPCAPWIGPMLDFHATVRELLQARRWLAFRRARGEPEAITRARFEARLRRAEALRSGWSLRPATVSLSFERLVAPPRGRVLELAYEALERRHGIDRRRIERLLFAPA